MRIRIVSLTKLSTYYSFLTIVLLGCQHSVKPEPQKIACIGSSITLGYGLSTSHAYPAQLQVLKGSAYQVSNYGVNGATVLKKGDIPYSQTDLYKLALASNPNIVVIELGTNDSKKQNWTYRNEFKSDYIELIKSFQALSGSPKIYICLPTPAYADIFDINSAIVNKEVVTLVTDVCKQTNTQLINLHDLTLLKEPLFQDGIHPTAEGASVIAKEINRAISQ